MKAEGSVQEFLISDGLWERIKLHDLTHILPQPARRQALTAQVAFDGVVAPALKMIGQVGQRVVDLTANQKLAVIQFTETHNHSLALIRT